MDGNSGKHDFRHVVKNLKFSYLFMITHRKYFILYRCISMFENHIHIKEIFAIKQRF